MTGKVVRPEDVRIGLVSTAGADQVVALPVPATIEVTGLCANCRTKVRAYVGPDGEVFTWHHAASGNERCPERQS